MKACKRCRGRGVLRISVTFPFSPHEDTTTVSQGKGVFTASGVSSAVEVLLPYDNITGYRGSWRTSRLVTLNHAPEQT